MTHVTEVSFKIHVEELAFFVNATFKAKIMKGTSIDIKCQTAWLEDTEACQKFQWGLFRTKSRKAVKQHDSPWPCTAAKMCINIMCTIMIGQSVQMGIWKLINGDQQRLDILFSSFFSWETRTLKLPSIFNLIFVYCTSFQSTLCINDAETRGSANPLKHVKTGFQISARRFPIITTKRPS